MPSVPTVPTVPSDLNSIGAIGTIDTMGTGHSKLCHDQRVVSRRFPATFRVNILTRQQTLGLQLR